MNNRLIKSNDAGGGACTNTVDLYNPFPDGGGVALYQLNGDATDEGGNYDGAATSVTYGTGKFGQAGVFNGSSSLISAPNNSLLTQTQFSVSAWVNHNSATGYRTIISNYGYTVANGESGWIIALNAGKVRVFNVVSGASYFVDSTASVPGGVFTNIAVTNTKSQVNIYINGLLDSTHSMNGFVFNLAINNYLTIGAYRYDAAGSPNAKFSGSIDQVRIFNRALRPYEVEALYTEEYCTPTIVPSEHFNAVLYTGTNASQDISVGFTPDLVWIKGRTYSDVHALTDSVRGDKKWLASNLTNSEYDYSAVSQGISIITNGFNNGGPDPSLIFNKSGEQYVSWNFKAGGAAVTNTDGTITSQVSANTEAGFSIVSYTGNGANGTVGHGLGVTPNIVLSKRRTGGTSAWSFNGNVGGLVYGSNKLTLETTNPIVTDTNEILAANSNNFTAGTSTAAGASGSTYIAYCFAEVEGFSNFGSYVGTGAAGNTIVTGFEPAFVMIKRTDAAASWYMIDNKRSPENVRDRVLFANLSNAEQQGQSANYYPMNFLENGFELTQAVSDGYNANGGKYIYMAFAADPTAVEPSLEDSFNTVLYTGNRGTKEVTGIGFQPDFVWIKNRDAVASNFLHDTVRGKNNNYYESLISNATFAESTTNQAWHNSYGWISDIYDGGFTINQGTVINDPSYNNTQNYVAWAWKGAEIPAINSNGSITSVVSANPAAGFSIVSYTGNGTTATVGHGLDSIVDLLIVKGRETTNDWSVLHKDNTNGNFLQLNGTAAESGSGSIFGNPTARPTDSVFTIGNTGETGTLNKTYIAYCFAEVAGFSKFGSYTGTQTTNNPTIDCGFEPAFVMIKCTSHTMNWAIFDNKRDTTNPNEAILYPNLSIAETNSSASGVNFLANGFQINSNLGGWINTSGYNFIYMAFANQF